MNERQITMLAVRYLSQVLNAIQFELYSRSVSDDVLAIQASMDCADYIEKISELDTTVAELRPRMMLIAESMRWLALKRDEMDAVFVNSTPSIPTIEDVEKLMGAASVKFN